MQKPISSILTKSISPERKNPKIVIQTPKHKHTFSLITPKSSSFQFKPVILSASKPKFSSAKFAVPCTTTKNISKHKHAFSEQFSGTLKKPKLIKRKTNTSPFKKNSFKNTKVPITPQTTLALFLNSLNSYEETEILNFPEIYYIGIGSNKVKTAISNNFGFDDDRGDFKIIVSDHIAYRYEIKSNLGKGSFGQVVKAFDHKSQKEVALKIIKNKPRFHQQALEEVEILRYLQDKDNEDTYCIVRMLDHFVFRKHMVIFKQCITFEMLSIDLYQYLKLYKFQGIGSDTLRQLSSQILQALRLIDRYKIIHCDLKPENILLKSVTGTSLKVIDFGSACFHEKRMYTYIQSRFYRAPEVILGLSYSTAIDMWSFGCILVELYTGRPMFPGENESEQMQYIMEVLGLPPRHLLEKATRTKLFFDELGNPKLTANSKGRKRYPSTKTLSEILSGADSRFVDLVQKCLEWDYHQRITPDEALLHDWMQESEAVVPAGRKLKHQRACSDASFLKVPQRFDKLSSYIEG